MNNIQNFTQAREFVENERKRGSVYGLDTMRKLLNLLGNPQEKVKVIQIAGTNGKGSVSSYISEMMIAAGYKVGRYNSPYVFEYEEMFTINNKNISEDDYVSIIIKIKDVIDKMKEDGDENHLPTAFEIETALAYLYFSQNEVDFALMEAGMGGREDATNALSSNIMSVITSIDFDHKDFLGDTLEKIAYQKAGIIKENSIVVLGNTVCEKNNVRKVFEEEGKKSGAKVILTNGANAKYKKDKTIIDYKCSDGKEFKDICTYNIGTFQKENVATAIESVRALSKLGYEKLMEDEVVYEGIKNSRWHGRFEKISTKPLVYIDGGHNPEAIKYVRESIKIYFTKKKIVYIIGVLKDKDFEKILEKTAEFADEIITITPPDNNRALDGEILKNTAKKYNKNVLFEDDIIKALDSAKNFAGDEGVIFVYGSLSYIGKIKENLLKGQRK
ncbi:dihydrofolate synthase / folylpolyglutamate synthase [Lachnospiraceae bacterium RM5]|nr:dihydrofolate synthase / folylpolyglutamate synthase [Lachnospiraceae bacterium RM5]